MSANNFQKMAGYNALCNGYKNSKMELTQV